MQRVNDSFKANSADPDEMPRSATSHLGLHFFVVDSFFTAIQQS